MISTMNGFTHIVTGGPDRYLLQESLFSLHRPRIETVFHVRLAKAEGEKKKDDQEVIAVNGAELENGSGFLWRIKGHNVWNGSGVEIQYDLSTRKGWMRFVRK